jgi:hypothetical protein
VIKIDPQRYVSIGLTALIVFVLLIGIVRLGTVDAETATTGLVSLELTSQAQSFTAEMSQEKLFSEQPLIVHFSSVNEEDTIVCNLSCKIGER